jgi:RNA polymerase sporulation-specific sigma factor
MNAGTERFVRTVVRKFGRTGIAEEDLFQEGMLAMLKAEKTYNSAVGTKFETYASTIIRNRIIDIIRAKAAKPKDDGVNAEFTVGKTLEDEIDLIEKNRLLKSVLAECTEIERAVFSAYFQGFSYEEIKTIFNVNSKKIDNTIQKVKRRVKDGD